MIDDVGRWRVRAAFEVPDASTTVALPVGWRWSDVCRRVVNSDGVANDPLRLLVTRGGRLHTKPYRADRFTDACAWMFRVLRPRVNYRAAMTVQVNIPGLSDRLGLITDLVEYTRHHLPPLWHRVDPLGVLVAGQGTVAAQRAAHTYLTATMHARHWFMSAARHGERMRATSVAQFVTRQRATASDGRLLGTGPSRECLDLGDVHGSWVTLRCFAQAQSLDQVRAAAGFAVGWLRAALSGEPPGPVVDRWEASLPRQLPFVYELEQGWAASNFEHHTRNEVAAVLAVRERVGRPG